MNSEFLQALNEIEKEKNISKDILLDAIDAALVSAYKWNNNTNQNNCFNSFGYSIFFKST